MCVCTHILRHLFLSSGIPHMLISWSHSHSVTLRGSGHNCCCQCTMSSVIFVTIDWLIKVLLFVAAYQVFYCSADDSTAGCHGDCGHEGICAGDHFCSLALHNEPYCRPCADILDHYCHNLTHIQDKFPQCLYYCEAGEFKAVQTFLKYIKSERWVYKSMDEWRRKRKHLV